MNEKMNELYIKFHTERRLFIEKETERRMNLRIATGWNNSPSVRKQCLYEAMAVRSEVDEFRMVAELIIKECIKATEEMYSTPGGPTTDEWWEGYDARGVDSIEIIKDHFGVE